MVDLIAMNGLFVAAEFAFVKVRPTRVNALVERGSPADIILDSIKLNEIHAIVIGTTGRSGIDRILLGSVAEQTVRTAPVPVITVARET